MGPVDTNSYAIYKDAVAQYHPGEPLGYAHALVNFFVSRDGLTEQRRVLTNSRRRNLIDVSSRSRSVSG